MEPLIPMSKITSEAEWIGKMLLKIKDIKTEEDLKNFKGLRITLKSLLAYNCFNLIYEIKAYLISLGIPKETIEKYGGPYFHEGYLKRCRFDYNEDLEKWKIKPQKWYQKIFSKFAK